MKKIIILLSIIFLSILPCYAEQKISVDQIVNFTNIVIGISSNVTTNIISQSGGGSYVSGSSFVTNFTNSIVFSPLSTNIPIITSSFSTDILEVATIMIIQKQSNSFQYIVRDTGGIVSNSDWSVDWNVTDR